MDFTLQHIFHQAPKFPNHDHRGRERRNSSEDALPGATGTRTRDTTTTPTTRTLTPSRPHINLNFIITSTPANACIKLFPPSQSQR